MAGGAEACISTVGGLNPPELKKNTSILRLFSASNTGKCPESKLPRSKTMSALQDLKASISRPALATRSGKTSDSTILPRKHSSTSESTITTEQISNPSSLRLWPTHSSVTSLVRSSRSCTPETISSPTANPVLVTKWQPSEYWTGRFVSLQDRLMNDAMNERDIQPLARPGDCDPAKD